MSMLPPRLVCFDFDGVVANTENAHVAAWERTFALMGCDISAQICTRAAEEDDHEFLLDVLTNQAVAHADIEGWLRRKQEITRCLLADAPLTYPGLSRLISALAERDVLLAVVSGTWRENVVAVLRSSRLLDRFPIIIAKEDVKARKPAPDAYLLALSRANVEPAHAVAIEDSPSGLQAARAAGVRGVAVGHRRPAGTWTEGAIYVSNFNDVEAVLSALGVTAPAGRTA
jgi:HAD superfamily hydrolase (TIGR01509 family)